MERIVPDAEFEIVFEALDALATELRRPYDRYDSLDALLAARSEQVQLPVEVTKKAS